MVNEDDPKVMPTWAGDEAGDAVTLGSMNYRHKDQLPELPASSSKVRLRHSCCSRTRRAEAGSSPSPRAAEISRHEYRASRARSIRRRRSSSNGYSPSELVPAFQANRPSGSSTPGPTPRWSANALADSSRNVWSRCCSLPLKSLRAGAMARTLGPSDGRGAVPTARPSDNPSDRYNGLTLTITVKPSDTRRGYHSAPTAADMTTPSERSPRR